MAYTIRRGDTLSALARKHGTTVAELARLNKIKDPNKIRAGAALTIPGTSLRSQPIERPSPKPGPAVRALPPPNPSIGAPPPGLAKKPGALPPGQFKKPSPAPPSSRGVSLPPGSRVPRLTEPAPRGGMALDRPKRTRR